MTIRPYTAKDRADCEAVFRTNVPRWFRKHELPGFLQFLDIGECPYFVIEHAGNIVACGGYGRRPGSDTADLCWGMVAMPSHRKGFGSQLLTTRLRCIAADEQFSAVRLGTSQLTEGFYRRFGFVAVERKKDGIAEGLDVVEMRLEFTPDNRKQILLSGTARIRCSR